MAKECRLSLALKIIRSLCQMRIWIAQLQQIVNAAFGSAGERCMACAVVVAVGDVADELVAKLVEAGRSNQYRQRDG